MNPFIRWAKFNLVGAMGMAVQLAALALLNRWTAGHYLYASAAAVELALLHNFMWHLHYTWRDRRDGATRLRPFVRFHLSNGLVSMLGNLALMRLLVNETRLPLLVSNVVAILCCSLANFWIGNNWAFSGTRQAEASLRTSATKDLVIRGCQNRNSVETGPFHARRTAVGTSDRVPYRAQARTWPA
jgi:putative flippase GtrA